MPGNTIVHDMSMEPSAPAQSDDRDSLPDQAATPAAEPERRYPGAAVLGGILVAVGLLFLVTQQLNVDLGDVGWPFFVIAPGVAITVLGLTMRHGIGLAVGGSIASVVGLVLLYQNATDHWESWAYAWALVGPGGSGLGMLLYGARNGDASMMRAGFWQILGGVGLFAAGFVFFEGVIGISGRRFPLPEWVLPAIVIAFGAVLMIRGLTARRDTEQASR
jgi:hypothetical protein